MYPQTRDDYLSMKLRSLLQPANTDILYALGEQECVLELKLEAQMHHVRITADCFFFVVANEISINGIIQPILQAWHLHRLTFFPESASCHQILN